MLAERKEQQRLRSADSWLAARLVPVLTFHTGLFLIARRWPLVRRTLTTAAGVRTSSFLLGFPGSNLTTALLSAVSQYNVASLGKSR